MNASKIALLSIALLLAACAKDTPQALGTLEYDRVTLPAPVAERIVAVDVREGQQVEAGARLLVLERTRTHRIQRGLQRCRSMLKQVDLHRPPGCNLASFERFYAEITVEIQEFVALVEAHVFILCIGGLCGGLESGPAVPAQ